MSDPQPQPRPTTGLPLWVKVVGGILALLVLLFVIQLVSGGRHGPSRHSSDLGHGAHAAEVVTIDVPPLGGR